MVPIDFEDRAAHQPRTRFRKTSYHAQIGSVYDRGMASIAARILVEGLVQGVFYRRWTESSAKALGLTGWVRNLEDGRVEIFVEGDGDAIEELKAKCRIGPPAARVSSVSSDARALEGFRTFELRPTAPEPLGD